MGNIGFCMLLPECANGMGILFIIIIVVVVIATILRGMWLLGGLLIRVCRKSMKWLDTKIERISQRESDRWSA
jgi:hypothetical protein